MHTFIFFKCISNFLLLYTVYQNPKFENNPEVEIKYEVNTLNNVY